VAIIPAAFAVFTWVKRDGWPIAMGLLLVAFAFFGFTNRRLIGDSIRRKIRSTPFVGDLQQSVSDLSLRNQILGDVSNLDAWTQQLIETPADGRTQYFDRLNQSFVDVIRDRFPQVQRIALFAPTSEGSGLFIRYSARFGPERPRTLQLPLDSSAAGYAYRTGMRYYPPDVTQEANSHYVPLPGSQTIRTLLCVPLARADSVTPWTVMSADSIAPSALTDDMIELVEVLCKTLAVTWDVFQLLGQRGGHRDEHGTGIESVAAPLRPDRGPQSPAI